MTKKLLAATILFSLCFAASVSGWIQSGIDTPLLVWFNALPAVLYPLMVLVTTLGSAYAIIVWVMLGYGVAGKRGLLTVALAGYMGFLTSQVIKVITSRERPYDVITSIHHYALSDSAGFSFPSGHATMSAACAISIVLLIKHRYRWMLLILPLFVGISRMYMGVHYPTDVLAGWILGAAVAVSADWLVRRPGANLRP